MKAHECMKLKGLSECRKLIDGVNTFAVACDVVCDPMLVLDVDNFVSYNDLKKLVESHELVEEYGGLHCFKTYCNGDFSEDDLCVIADVESCQ